MTTRHQPAVEPGQTWLDVTARIDGQKPSPGMRRVVRVLRILTSAPGMVECSSTWQTMRQSGAWQDMTGPRTSRTRTASWGRRMRLIRNADGSEVAP